MGQQQNLLQIPQIQANQFMKILLTKEMIYQNEEVKGEIFIIPPQQVILQDIIIKVRVVEGWVFQESSDVVYSDLNDRIICEVPLNISKLLNINVQLITLSVQEYKFPFIIQIPKDIIPSFEFPMPNRRGYIRYSIIAEAISPYFKCAYENFIIIKSRPCVLNSPLKISNTANVHKWGLFDRGSTTLTVSYNTTNYKIGDQIPLNVIINNNRGKLNVTTCTFSIIRRVTFNNKTDTVKYPIEKTIFQYKYPIRINIGTTNSFNFSIIVRDNEISDLNYAGIYNPFPFISDHNILMPCVNGMIIKCRYFINVVLSFDSAVTSGYKPNVNLPIWITHQTMNEYDLEKKEDDELQKVIEISKIEYKEKESRVLIDNDDNYNIFKSDVKDNQFQKNNFNNIDNNNVPISQSNFVNREPYQNNNNYPKMNFDENNHQNFITNKINVQNNNNTNFGNNNNNLNTNNNFGNNNNMNTNNNFENNNNYMNNNNNFGNNNNYMNNNNNFGNNNNNMNNNFGNNNNNMNNNNNFQNNNYYMNNNNFGKNNNNMNNNNNNFGNNNNNMNNNNNNFGNNNSYMNNNNNFGNNNSYMNNNNNNFGNNNQSSNIKKSEFQTPNIQNENNQNQNSLIDDDKNQNQTNEPVFNINEL